MYNKLLAIDFETANSRRSSVCSVGYALYENDNIITKEILINPEEPFDSFNIDIHGITPEMVKDKEVFPVVWEEIENLIDENTLVIAHNASFDMSVLRYACDKYGLVYPILDYVCTWRLGKKHYEKFLSYSLDNIADELGILFNHHNAREDAAVCLKIYQDIMKNYTNIDDVLENFELKKGKLFRDSYIPCANKYKNKSSYSYNIKNIVAEKEDFDEEHPFYDKTIIFTGTLSSMPRKEAMKKVVNVGGKIGNTLVKNTNYLIMGVQDMQKLKGKGKSSKVLKAEKYIKDGADIELIGEDIFLQML